MSRVLLTVPVWNEALCLQSNMRQLLSVCERSLTKHAWVIELTDNGSTDETVALARLLAEENSRVRVRCLNTKGKGAAIAASWLGHADQQEVFVFLDSDLAADIETLPKLIQPILDAEADAVCGSRFHPGTRLVRSWKREFFSRAFRLWQRWMLGIPLADIQCGYKAVSARVVREIVPFLEERQWLFDAELLFAIQSRGWVIKALPVDWVEHRDPRRRSALSLRKDAAEFLFGLWRIRRQSRKS